MGIITSNQIARLTLASTPPDEAAECERHSLLSSDY